MADTNLIMNLPQGVITATRFDVQGFARHRSPGSGKHFRGRKVFVELAVAGDRPGFEYLDEGGWRDVQGDTEAALGAVGEGKRTRTALSNNGFSCTPLEAYKNVLLVKTGGEVVQLEKGPELHRFASHERHDHMSLDEIARAVGVEPPEQRRPRLYLVVCPVELLILSNLTPNEYAWYATHRPGKMFRQVMFTELTTEQPQLAAHSLFEDAREELLSNPTKKTKTIVAGDCINDIPFRAWRGYDQPEQGGLYTANREQVGVWRLPSTLPHAWERAAG